RQHIVAVDTQGGNRMRESCKYGSVRGALSNERPYRDRREFIMLLGASVAWPLAARAQQPAMPVIGLLSGRSPAVDAPLIAIIRQGLNEMGFVESRNVVFDYRWAEGQYDRLPGLAADLTRTILSPKWMIFSSLRRVLVRKSRFSRPAPIATSRRLLRGLPK